MKNVLNALKKPQLLVALLLVVIVAVGAYYYKNQVEPVSTNASVLSDLTGPDASCDFYASPTELSSGDGSSGNPWDLQTALDKTAQITAGKTLCLKGGTYAGKYASTLNGGTVRSAPGEWAVIDGNKTTTLTTAIDSSTQLITIASTVGLLSGESIAIDTEIVQIDTVRSSTSLWVNRGWGGSIGGAVAHSSGAPVLHIGNQLQINSSNTTYRDFEITSSNTQRDLEPGNISGQGCCGFYAAVRGAGVSQTSGSGNSYINLIVHDNLDGFFVGSNTSNTTLYGNLIYNNGGHYFDTGESREAGSGHGIYAENSSGFSRMYANMSMNNFNFNGQFYGVSAPYVGGDHRDNVFANAGSPLGGLTYPNLRNFNIVYGPNAVRSPSANIVNNHYFAPYEAFGGTPAYLGYGAGIGSATVTGNYFVGGPQNVSLGDITTMTAFTGNKFYGPSSSTYINRPSGTTITAWDNNSYFGAGTRGLFYNGVDGLDFTTWKSTMGVDASSNATSTVMPDTVVVIPNIEQAGRAHLVIYAPSSPSTINVNLSSAGLTNGQNYVIKNAFNIFGSNVFSGTYNSASPIVSLPLTGAATSVAAPIGNNFTPASTCPSFCSLVVLPTSTVTTPSDTTAPTINMTAPTSGATVSGSAVTVSATASDDIGVVGVQFKLDGTNLGAEDTSSPYSTTWDSTTASNASHTLTAVARDGANNIGTSTNVDVTVNNVVTPSTVATPSISPNGGSFTAAQSVSLSTATTGASIRYTTDGSTPSSTAGTLYSAAFSISSTTTLKAIAYKSGSTDSSIASATFTITSPPTTGPAPKIISFGLSSKTQTSATLTWTTDIPATGSISYGINKNSLSQSITETSPSTCTSTSCTHTATISNLSVNTNYYYRITATNDGASTTSIRSSFRTSR